LESHCGDIVLAAGDHYLHIINHNLLGRGSNSYSLDEHCRFMAWSDMVSSRSPATGSISWHTWNLAWNARALLFLIF
jgi:hypothetical protein